MQTLDALEAEGAERVRLERELTEMRAHHADAQRRLETLESETLELRLYKTKRGIELQHELKTRYDIEGRWYFS